MEKFKSEEIGGGGILGALTLDIFFGRNKIKI